MRLIDTHCHLNDKQLFPHVDELVLKANENDVVRMQVVGYDELSSKIALELAERFSSIYAIVGIHPTEVNENLEVRLKEIETLALHNRVVAIGETGLDYYWHKQIEQHKLQQAYFIQQIEIANRLQLPVVIHSRDAMQATLQILKENRPQYGGVMHCYSGPAELVSEFIALGMYISLAGPVTFLNAKTPKEVALIVPLERLLIETDSPYLAPHPNRGKRNDPSLLPLILNTIAQIRKEDPVLLAEITSTNAELLFHVKHK